MLFYKTIPSPVGNLTLVSDQKKLIGLWIENQKYFKKGLEQEVLEEKTTPVLQKTEEWLTKYFQKENPKISEIPLGARGTLFQQQVWKKLCEIPYGKSVSYSSLAKNLKTSARAIGNAVSKNPISILIPCHRVVGKDGALTGYAGGIDVKQKLLELEKE